MHSPRVSVIMPVYNGEKYLKKAIEGILSQTFKDFELIIINDGSNDKTLEIIKSYADSRIRLISQENKGIIYSLNRGIAESRGKYIARMDADDISLPERLEKQREFLENNPEYGIIGSTYFIMNQDGAITGVQPVLLYDEDLKNEIIFQTVFGHGTVMMRKNIINWLGGYSDSKNSLHVEDYELWIRIAQKTKIANLPDILYIWRVNPEGISRSKEATQRINAKNIKNSQLRKLSDLHIFETKRLFKYKNEEVWYDSKKYTIRRRDRLSFLYFRIGYFSFKQRRILQGIKAIILSLALNPFTILAITRDKIMEASLPKKDTFYENTLR